MVKLAQLAMVLIENKFFTALEPKELKKTI